MNSVGGVYDVLIGGFFMAYGKTLKESGAELTANLAAGFAAGVQNIC